MRTSLFTALLLFSVACLTTACGPDRSQPPAKPLGPEHYVIAPEDRPAAGQHMRYAESAVGQAGGLDIAVTEYRKPEGGPTVALFGVIHVADAFYFAAVQRELDTYDTVLYEGVKPAELSNAEWQASFKEGGGESSQLQQEIAGWFGLEFQLHAIDYTRENFVHADMSMETFLGKGGASLIPGVGKKASGKDISATAGAPGGRAGAAAAGGLSDPVRSTLAAVKAFGASALAKPGPLRSLARKMFAETLGTTDIGKVLEMQPGFSDLILIQRNTVVLERLGEVLSAPESADRETDQDQRTIAIFYGAAHMDDLEERLTTKLGYERVRAHWLRAWAIRPPRK